MLKNILNLLLRVILLLSLLRFDSYSYGQLNIGIPDIRNYSRLEYKAGSQNWGIIQDSKGIMYFGNNEGLLSFDGAKWRLYPLPLKGNVRSLAIDGNRIYIGGQEEIGYFYPTDNGDLSYHSIKDLIPLPFRHDFADVWNVVIDHHRVFFRSNRHVFLYEKARIISFQSYNWSYLGKIDNNVVGFDDGRGLCQYVNGKWVVVIDKKQLPQHVQISGLLNVGTAIWIVTYNNGIYKWVNKSLMPFSTVASNQLKNQMIYGAVSLSNSEIALTTNLVGCVILDTSGQYVNRFTHKEGLQNNNILSSFVDKERNLWLGLGDGIDIVQYNKPIRSLYPGENGSIAGYTSALFKNELFLGTATGVYKIKYNDKGGFTIPYQILQSANGQIWNLAHLQDRLWIGQYKSALVYNNGNLKKINKSPTGFWNFQQIPGTDYVISGTYNGIHYFKYNKGDIEDIGIESLFESAKYVVVDHRTIWAMHPYKGLYRIDLSPDGLPINTIHLDNTLSLSPNNNHLFKVANRVIISSEKGIFEWSNSKNTFIPSEHFISIFGNRDMDYIVENSKGSYWFIQNGELGIAYKKGNRYQLHKFPDLNGRLQFGENENITLLNDSCAIVAAEKGFFYIDYARYQAQKKDFSLLIRSFQIQTPNKDSIIFGGYGMPNKIMPTLSFKYNSILFTYGVPVFGYNPPGMYSYKLEGVDQSWSIWSEKNEKNYTNLSPGNYCFWVKAKNQFDGKEKIICFKFIVLAPWYRTNFAYALYCILIIVGIYWFSLFQHRRYIAMQESKLFQQKEMHTKREKELALQYSLAQEKKEKQLAEITNEKLAIELEMKNTTIATNAMLLVQKGELLSKVKKDLSSLLDIGKEEKTKTQLKKIIRTVDAEINNKEDWDKFATYFDTVHENYLKRLKEKYTHLTYGDLKLCALLRLGMSSKEIASVLNISLKGVEVGRYRLRKKLNITEERSLFDFLTM